MKINLDKNKSILEKSSNDIKQEIISILQEITTVEEYKSYFEISLPLFLDDSYRVSLYLDKKRNILYNNLYIVLENSICEKLGKQKNIVKDFLNNDKEFLEIKQTLLQFGINYKNLTLDYKINLEEDITEQILIYSEMIKKYYNNLYNIILYRFESKKNKKHIYYESFDKIITEFKGLNKFEKIEYSGISGSPIYSNNNITVAASKDFEALTRFYVDLEDLEDVFKDKKGILFCNNYNETNSKSIYLKKKIEKKSIKLVTFKEMEDEKKLKEEIENNLKIDGVF